MVFFRNLFGGGKTPSALDAKERLRVVIMHDRSDISPELLDNLRVEIIAVLKKYMEIDESKIEMDLDQGRHTMSLIASIPVTRIKSQDQEPGEGNAKGVAGDSHFMRGRNPGFKNKRHR